MRTRHSIFSLVAPVLLVAVAGVRPCRAGEPSALEQQVKSAFVVNFVQFTDWPASAFDNAEDPIIIGVLDPKALGEALTAAIQGKSVRGRKLEIRTMTADSIGKCHVLIVGNAEGADAQRAIKAAEAASILTIGDAEQFTSNGGMIRFYVEDRKERFEINQAAAQRAQLQISSKLLKLAKVVNN